MTGSQLKTFVESLIDDTINNTLFYQLLNVAKDNLEEERDWEYLKALDSSITVDSSTVATTQFDLPSDFKNPLRVYIGNSDPIQYTKISFEERVEYEDGEGWYYIDSANNKISFIGNYDEQKNVYLYYLKETSELASGNSPDFPSRFHKLLGFIVAGYYTAGVDVDDIYARMSPAHRLAARELKNSMRNWDNKKKIAAVDYSSVPRNYGSADNDRVNIYE